MGKEFYIPNSEHKFTLPDMPKRSVKIKGIYGDDLVIPMEDLVLNMKATVDESYWKRVKLPKFFYDYNPDSTELDADQTVWDGPELISLNKTDTQTLSYLFEREMYRRKNGVWFKNGDEYEYLTGHHYFFLQWTRLFGISEKMVPVWREKGYEYGEYREFQRDIFYLIDKVNGDPNILGLYVAKSKKTGVTQLFAGYQLNKATMTRVQMMGIMSKGGDAVDVNMKLFFYGYDGLPMIFQPSIKFRGDQEGNIEFGEPNVKNTRTKAGKARRIQIQNSNPMDTRVFAAKTKAAGFDSPTMTDIFFDELPKYDTENKQSPEVVFTRNKDTVKLQTFFNGRIWIYSYPPEYDTPGFFQARKIYFNGKLSTIKNNPLGRTENGLISYYVSALNSYMECFDKYGKCDSKKAHVLNKMERDSAKDKRAKQALIRLYSETERECWSSSGAGSTFDNVRLGEIEFDLKRAYDEGKRFFVSGRLVFENSMWEVGNMSRRPLRQFCPVKMIPLTEDEVEGGLEGKLRLYGPVDQTTICAALRRERDQYGNLMPPAVITNYGGIDPTEYADGAEVNQGSKNANYTMNFADPARDRQFGQIVTNIILSEYFHRPDNPEEYYQDVVKEILFFDKIVMVESNKKWLATRLIQDGLGRFLLVKDKESGIYQLWQPVVVRNSKLISDNSWYTLPQVTTGGDEKGAIVRSISKFIVSPPLGEVDYAALIRSERLLTQLMDFDPENAKFFDLVMGYGWTLICGETIRVIPMKAEDPAYSTANVRGTWDFLLRAG